MHKPTLKSLVTQAINDYLVHLDGEHPQNLYHIVLNEVEGALLNSALNVAKGNQSKASECLGISRTTFRKKLAEHNLLSGNI